MSISDADGISVILKICQRLRKTPIASIPRWNDLSGDA